MNTEEKEEIKFENLVKLNINYREHILFAEGKLTYVTHPTKGLVGVDFRNIFVNTIELTEKEKSRLG